MSIRYHMPETLDRKDWRIWIAAWFGCGFLSPGPGTWGSFGGLMAGLFIATLFSGLALLLGVFLISAVGFLAAERFDSAMNTHDSKMIVVDEVAGQWIAMIPALGSVPLLLLSFILFRGFDIIKPWPVSHFEKNVAGAAGVMGDDIVAGLIAAVCIIMVRYVF